jgi:hypothetical protein
MPRKFLSFSLFIKEKDQGSGLCARSGVTRVIFRGIRGKHANSFGVVGLTEIASPSEDDMLRSCDKTAFMPRKITLVTPPPSSMRSSDLVAQSV